MVNIMKKVMTIFPRRGRIQKQRYQQVNRWSITKSSRSSSFIAIITGTMMMDIIRISGKTCTKWGPGSTESTEDWGYHHIDYHHHYHHHHHRNQDRYHDETKGDWRRELKRGGPRWRSNGGDDIIIVIIVIMIINMEKHPHSHQQKHPHRHQHHQHEAKGDI